MMTDCCDHRGPCLAALLALAVTGCGESLEPTGVAEVQIRDSAGIRIVEYAGTPSVPTLTLADEPLYTHGTGPDVYQFASIGAAALYPDGSAAVFDWRNREIILLGPYGAFLNVLARQGDGPGEISQYGTIALTADGTDTLLVADDWQMLPDTLRGRGRGANRTASAGRCRCPRGAEGHRRRRSDSDGFGRQFQRSNGLSRFR